MNKLPKYWVVLNNDTKLFQDTVIKYLREVYKEQWEGNVLQYYGYDGGSIFHGTYCHAKLSDFSNPVTVLTLEQFIEMSKEEFVLPNKWYVEHSSEALEWIRKNAEHNGDSINNSKYYYYPCNNSGNNFSFKKYVLEEKKEEFILPEKWCLKVTEENKEFLQNLEHYELYFPKHYDYSIGGYYNIAHEHTHGSTNILPDFVEITFEQFKEFVLNNKQEQKEENMERKIIGYKAPFSMTGSTDYINAGEIFSRKGNDFFYTNDGTVKRKNPLPKEIVETWEPVYEEFKVGDWVYAEYDKEKSNDWRRTKHIPTFRIKQIKGDYLRPVDGEGTGIQTSYCRQATKEEIEAAILSEAKLNYPVGTRFIDLVNNKEFTVADHFHFDTFNNPNQLYVAVDSIPGYSNKTARIYKDGVWAEIIVKTKKDLLLEEAIRRYPAGSIVNSLGGYDNHLNTLESLERHPIRFTSAKEICGYGVTLYSDGKWAEIVKEPNITIKGYKAAFTKDNVSFGCQVYTKEFILTLNKCLENNKFDMSYQKEIKEIADYFNNNK